MYRKYYRLKIKPRTTRRHQHHIWRPANTRKPCKYHLRGMSALKGRLT